MENILKKITLANVVSGMQAEAAEDSIILSSLAERAAKRRRMLDTLAIILTMPAANEVGNKKVEVGA